MMASISTSIELYDRVSAPIYKMLGALGNLTSAFESVETSIDGGFDATKIEDARRKVEQASLEVIELGNDIENVGKKSKQSSSDVDGLTDKIMGLVGAYVSLQGVKKLVNLSDEYVQTTARLNMINDGLQTTDELQDKIFASAQRARASYADTADMVAKLQLRAGDAFSSNDEAIAFAETLNKMYTIAGAGQQEMAAANLQLVQALGSGVLRGQEFNAVFEQAPNVMQAIADYMDVPIGKLREMAEDGQITANIVKNAMFAATNDVNAQFKQMPMTWGQVWTGIMNKLYVASQPILELISWLAQNWSVLEPIVLGVAGALAVYLAATKGVELATKAWAAAQAFFNGVMALNPVFLVVMAVILLIAAIYAIVAAINKVTGSTTSALGVIVGAIMAAVAFIWNLFLGLVDLVLACVNYIANPWIAFANFFANLFNDPIGSIIRLFGDLADNVLGIIESIAKAIDKVFGSNLAGAVQGWRSGLSGKVESFANKHGNGSYEKIMDGLNLSSESLGLKRWAYSDAYNTGYSWGEGAEDSVSNMFGSFTGDGLGGYDESQIPSNIADIAGNTGSMADSMEITSEDLKYLRDIAESEVVNRFTTAEIKVEMNNNNNISSDMDLDGVVDYLANGVNEAMEKAAEGVHE